MAASDLVSLDFELIVYRKGNLQAHVNLDRGYLTWRDSWQWCNNFTRTLSDQQIKEIRERVLCCSSTDQEDPDRTAADAREKTPEEPGFNPVSWLVTVQHSEETWQIRWYGNVPDCWLPLKELIEEISRICFFV